MPDKIDLDELDVQPDDDDERPNRGDWFWGDDDGDASGDPSDSEDGPSDLEDEPSGGDGDASPAAAPTAGGAGGTDDGDGGGTGGWRSGAARAEELGADEPEPTEYDDDLGADLSSSTPRVPYADDDRPVGIPREGGGGGGVSADAREEETQQQPEATGPHGETKSEMTMALSYRAVRSLANLHAALADAETWTDYVGIVGDVDAHVINKFQRDNRLDLDFFNGTGTGPGERLEEVGPNSMFHAERMVLVGVEAAGERAWAERADWEFVPLSEAAEASGWALADDAEAGAGDDAVGDDEGASGADATGGDDEDGDAAN
ncbi:DUF7124 domain-containing protein [Halobaculum gomorrense]|uniref:DUF7124 domain-containing protein n=1 Tax=Halobaculum gomorrense TaxID=43928 RepID=A0A1M5M884_9EURY|nr:hypothetical protein [Halobaculum gomorrense]SHG73189.1 hypothetical protein SAMN05443636_0910 [Halobaculum gomorrense]